MEVGGDDAEKGGLRRLIVIVAATTLSKDPTRTLAPAGRSRGGDEESGRESKVVDEARERRCGD